MVSCPDPLPPQIQKETVDPKVHCLYLPYRRGGRSGYETARPRKTTVAYLPCSELLESASVFTRLAGGASSMVEQLAHVTTRDNEYLLIVRHSMEYACAHYRPGLHQHNKKHNSDYAGIMLAYFRWILIY